MRSSGRCDRWLISTVTMGLLFVLSGCALVAPSEVDQRLDREYNRTRQVLRQAREWSPSVVKMKLYKRADQTMRKTRAEQQERPHEGLIPRYQKARLLAQRATIRVLTQQLADTEPTVKESPASQDKPWIQDNVVMSETRYRALQNRIAQLETRLDDSRQKNKRLKQRIEDRVLTVQQTKARLKRKQRTIARLRTRLEEASAPESKKTSTLKQVASIDTGELERQLRGAGSAITVDHTPLGLRVRIAQRVLFSPGEVTLKPEARRSLSRIAGHLQRFPEREIRVQGHTDDVPIHTPRYPSNWELSSHRAVNVVKHLVEREGLKAERIGAVAFGPHRPLVPNTSPENRAKNRRVEILLLSPSLSEVSE